VLTIAELMIGLLYWTNERIDKVDDLCISYRGEKKIKIKLKKT
jgi:hypothetical protein